MRPARSASRGGQFSESHQMRAPLAMLLVARTPSSVRSMSREWTHRRERATSSATSRALTVGASLSRITPSRSSSVTLRGRPPAPIPRIHPGWVINRTKRRGREQQIEVSSHAGYSRVSQSPRGVLETPARTNARGWLPTDNLMKATTADVLETIELSDRSRPCNQHSASAEAFVQEGSR